LVEEPFKNTEKAFDGRVRAPKEADDAMSLEDLTQPLLGPIMLLTSGQRLIADFARYSSCYGNKVALIEAR